MKKPIVVSSSGLYEEIARTDSLLVPFAFFNHFIGNLDNIFGTSTTGGGGPSVTSNADCVQGQFGALRLRCGTNAAGGALVHTGANMFRVSNAYGARFISGVALPVLSNATNRYNVRLGLKSSPLVFGDTTGFYIRYSDNVNGGNFQGIVRNGATESTIDFGVGPVAGQNFIVGFELATDYSSILFFYLNPQTRQKTDVGSILLSGGFVPALNTIFGAHASIQKNVGASLIDALVDFMGAEIL